MARAACVAAEPPVRVDLFAGTVEAGGAEAGDRLRRKVARVALQVLAFNRAADLLVPGRRPVPAEDRQRLVAELMPQFLEVERLPLRTRQQGLRDPGAGRVVAGGFLEGEVGREVPVLHAKLLEGARARRAVG